MQRTRALDKAIREDEDKDNDSDNDDDTLDTSNTKRMKSTNRSGSDEYHCRACDFTSKIKRSVTVHESGQHRIGKVFDCGIAGCNYFAGTPALLRTHMAGKHNIGVVWKPCTQPGCEKKFKQKSGLTKHLAVVHRIGAKHICCLLYTSPSPRD